MDRTHASQFRCGHKLVGMFVQMVAGVPDSQMLDSPTEHRDLGIEPTIGVLNSVPLTRPDLNLFEIKHNYLIDINRIIPYAKEI